MDHRKQGPKLKQLLRLLKDHASIKDISGFLDHDPELREYLRHNDTYSHEDFYTIPPLHSYLTLERPDLLKVFLAKNQFHPNARWIGPNDSMTPLHWAIDKNEPEVVSILLDHEADPSMGASTKTPLVPLWNMLK